MVLRLYYGHRNSYNHNSNVAKYPTAFKRIIPALYRLIYTPLRPSIYNCKMFSASFVTTTILDLTLILPGCTVTAMNDQVRVIPSTSKTHR